MTKFITVDYETYYSDEYSLRKMSPAEYILDPRFDCLGAAIKIDDQASVWVDGPDLPYVFRQIPWASCAHASHNASFDAAISSWRYGIQPGLWVDTLAMARPTIYPQTGTVSLDSCAKHLGLPAKGSAIHRMKGYRFAEFKANRTLYAEGTDYARHDADLCRQIYLALRSNFPPDEFIIMDMVVRMVANPQFELDPGILLQHLLQVQADKQALLDRLSMSDASELQSNDKFAVLLENLGVDPPRKVSSTTGKETWAFSKTDQEFLELQEHDDPDVQALMAARFGHKSTLEETRTRRFIAISVLPWDTLAPGAAITQVGANQIAPMMPVPLRYSGAHTHRLSGDWSMNLQNLNRKSKLRQALRAPRGYKVITADAAQIEARIVAWLAGQQDLVDAFANKIDVYSQFASSIFGYLVNKKNHLTERFIGKTGILGLGFGVGHIKFGKTIPIQSRNQLGREVRLPPGDDKRIVTLYRTKYSKIPKLWDICENLIQAMFEGRLQSWGPVFTRHNEIVLPNGMRLTYTDLERHTFDRKLDDGSTYQQVGWRYRHGKKWKSLYGAKVTENIVQALARILTMGAGVEMRRSAPQYPLALQCHDELVYVVRDEDVTWFTDLLCNAMKSVPSWAQSLPLEVEAGVGATYGDAK